MLGSIDEWFEKSALAMRNYLTVKALNTNIHALEFIGLMMSYLDRLRDQNNMLILDDTASYIKRIIDGSNIPFIYEHIGTQYRNFLIDEFQDTSRMQWDNIRPLVQNGCAVNDDSLIIGDTKQAIYRFRNSDSTILGHTLTATDFPDHSTRTIKGTNPEDNTNYRTAHPIVKLNNTIIPVLAANVFGLGTYMPGYTPADAVQACSDNTLPLPSRVRFIPFDKKLDDKIVATGHEVSALDTADLLSRTEPFDGKERIDYLIAEIIDQHNRGYRWGDIAILIRWNKSSPEIVKEMLKRGIPIRSGESLVLKNAPSIRLILSILHLLARAGTPDAPINSRSAQNPKTRAEARMEQALFEARYDYFIHARGCDPQTAISLALDPHTDDGAPVDADINHAIESILAEHPATLVAIIESIIEKGLVQLATVEAERDYVAAFEDLALRYGEEYDNDLNGFLAWWGLHGDKCTVPPPPDSDAVSIMTIHKAKGLEFKCVHLADFEWETITSKDKIWLDMRTGSPTNTYGIDLGLDVDPELIPPLMLYIIPGDVSKVVNLPFLPVVVDQVEKMQLDALNLAYVALTRPVNELNVYYLTPKKISNGPAADIAEAFFRSLVQLSESSATNNDALVDITPDIFNPAICALAFERDGVENPNDDSPGDNDRDPKPVFDPNDFLDIDYLAHYSSTSRGDVLSLVRVDSIVDGLDDDDDEGEDNAGDAENFHDDSQRRRGTDLHNILSGITVVDDLDAAVDAASRMYEYDETATDAYIDTIRRAITPEIAQRWFNADNDVSTEVSFFVPVDTDAPDDMGFTKRIDRLVVRPDGTADVVDFKFTAEETDRHRRQVAGYVKYVRRMLPDLRVTGYLWYIDLGKVVAVN